MTELESLKLELLKRKMDESFKQDPERAKLRIANTTEAIRKRVLEYHAKENGRVAR